MIKAIIFDVGGVLHGDSIPPIHKDIQKTLNISPEVFKKSYYPLIHSLVKGKITEEEFWNQFLLISQSKNQLPNESLFLREFIKNFQPHHEVLQIVKKL